VAWRLATPNELALKLPIERLVLCVLPKSTTALSEDTGIGQPVPNVTVMSVPMLTQSSDGGNEPNPTDSLTGPEWHCGGTVEVVEVGDDGRRAVTWVVVVVVADWVNMQEDMVQVPPNPRTHARPRRCFISSSWQSDQRRVFPSLRRDASQMIPARSRPCGSG